MRERDQNRYKKLMVYFIAFILVSSIFGVVFFGFRDPTAKRKYNDYTFIRTQQGYRTTIDKNFITFTYFPENLPFMIVDPQVKSLLSDKVQISMTSDFNDPLNGTIASLQFTLGPIYNDFVNTFIFDGFTNENPYRPIVTCENATPSIPVIYLKQGNETSAKVDQQCVIITAETSQDLIAINERILYVLLGIMEG